MLACRHGDGLGDKLVAQGSGRLRVQVLGHDGDLAEVASSQCVFVFDPAGERHLIRLNAHTEGRLSLSNSWSPDFTFLLFDQTNRKKTKQTARETAKEVHMAVGISYKRKLVVYIY